MDVCAREIAMRVMRDSGKSIPVLLGLSLKQYTPESVREVADMVSSLRVW
jgi:hypothetical protein